LLKIICLNKVFLLKFNWKSANIDRIMHTDNIAWIIEAKNYKYGILFVID